ncbi:MAG: hypothetical protein NTU73_02000 [Ignavibacteriae bacterium]|nr:hypothetical protein [Ignavibacteriota bacterium]
METITLKPNGRVLLFLPDTNYKSVRQIGYIKDRTFNTVRKPENHRYNKLNAIGLNYKFLSQGGSYFDLISIEYGFETLETSREYFLEFGDFLHFKNNGLDKQLFLSLDRFGMDKANEWKRQQTERLKNKFVSFGNAISTLKIQLDLF